MKKILFYGDSNTFGYDPSGFGGRYPEDVRWADILAEEMKDSLVVVPRGMNGRTIPASSWEYDAVDSMIKGANPLDYLAIMLGTNDVLLTMKPEWTKAARDMENLIYHIKDGVSQGKYRARSGGEGRGDFEIILITPPIIFPESPEGSPFKMYEENSVKLAEAYRELAGRESLILVDAAEWYVDLAFDGVHLSEAGSIEFGKKMELALRGIMND